MAGLLLGERRVDRCDPVQLLPLPIGRDTLARLAPLVRGAVLPLYPVGLRGPDSTNGDPVEELARILTSWGTDA